jgi:ATP-dependent helicase/nuclease subunit A
MMEPVLPPDHAVRTQALDTTRSYIVQAPAGSGKTELLTMRFLQLLGEVDSPEEILAITFTRAATAEMRRRILESLEKAASPEGLSEEQPVILARRVLLRSEDRGWDLLRNPHLLKIETIDSFSLAIANRTPILARLGGRLHPLESAESLYSLAAQRTLQKLGGADEQLSEAIAALLSLRDNRVIDCQELIAAMLSSRDRWQHAYVLSLEVDWQRVRVELEKPFLRAIRSTLKKLETMLVRSGVSGEEVVKLVSFACGNLALPGCETPHLEKIKALENYPGFPAATEDHLAAWRCFSPFLQVDKNKWRTAVDKRHGFPPGSTHEQANFASVVSRLERIPGLRETLLEVAGLPPAHYSEEQWALLAKLFLTLRHANAELAVIFAERGVVDFAELGLAAEHVLKYQDNILGDIPSDLALAKGDQLRHILVDEFQDTSRRQHSLLRKLTAGWLPLEGRTCFLAGDPMQSIYLFRQAEVELFQNAGRHGLTPDLPLQSLRLTTNFRSNRGVVEPLNTILASVFERNGGIGSAPVEFSPSVANDPAFYPNNVNIVADLVPAERSSDAAGAEARRREARAVVSIVESHRDRLAKAARENSDYRIAILGRARNHLLLIAEELRQQNIPFRAVELESLDERQEVIDLTALLRALLHPMDRVAWLAVLRAPWCGLTLADLHQLCGSDSREFTYAPVLELLRTRTHLLSEDGQMRSNATHLVLQEAMRQRLHHSTSQPLAPWLERTWHSLRGPQCIDETASQNVQVFFNMLEELDAEGIPYAGHELDDRLKRLFAQPDPRASERHGVQLMTIHKAKGLGFEVVIVPALDRPGKREESKLLTWLERSIPEAGSAEHAEESEILVAPIGGKGEDRNALNRWVTQQENIRLLEEQKRLFYVACTRARHELHLLGTVAVQSHFNKKSQSVLYKLKEPAHGSLLRTAWPGLEADFNKSLERWKHQQDNPITQAPPLGFPDTHSEEIQQTFAFAASAEKTLRRLPGILPMSQSRPSVTVSDMFTGTPDMDERFERPSGSLSARAFGIAVHTLLDRTARLLLTQPDYRLVQQSISRWIVATEHLLRQQGVPNAQARSLASDVIATVKDVLDDDTGRWILSPHPEAMSEAAWSGSSNGTLRNVRADRVFRAGEDSSDTGEDIYWIVDFKTASHGPSGLEDFLAGEKRQYSAQLEAYGEVLRMLKGPATRIKLALYYPVLRRLIDWYAE